MGKKFLRRLKNPYVLVTMVTLERGEIRGPWKKVIYEILFKY